MKVIYSLLFVGLVFSACKKTTSTEQAKIDEEIIVKYISDNSLTATATGSGLYYVMDEVGTGTACNSNSTVTVKYKGYFTNGDIFDQSETTGATFGLQQVIKGWTEGIPYFKEGGKGRLLIPSALGYGVDGSSSIPKNSVLIFDIELLDVL
jgi:FKBP-type peptidyl-prolyl cis-trans isomerase FkpA